MQSRIRMSGGRPFFDPALRTQTFCHGIEGVWTIYGAVLNAGMPLKWLKDNILREQSFEKLSEMAGEIPSGSEGLIFLPYLTGERTPHMDTAARGMEFYYIRGFKGEADLEPDIPPFSDKALEPVSNDSGEGIRLSGFIIPYGEGEKEVKLRLANPSYQWTKKLAIPVKMR